MLCNEVEQKKDEIDNLKSQNDALHEENQHLRNLMLSIREKEAQSSIHKGTTENGNDALGEKAILEEKIKSLEDAIEMYKLRLKMAESSITNGKEVIEQVNDRNNNENEKDELQEAEEAIAMEDLPVQGPIPKEPDEKLFFRDRKSRIWSFFPRLTRAFK